MKNNINLLIDYGNTYIKAALYDAQTKQFIEMETCEKTTNPRNLLTKFRKLSENLPSKIFEVSSARSCYTDPFNAELERLFKAKVRNIDQFDFKDIFDLSKLHPTVIVGADILCSTYYILRNFEAKDAAVFCFGTVYFATIIKDKEPVNCLFTPSITKGLELIPNDTTIVSDFIPKTFDLEKATNTFEAFSAGVNLLIEGFVDNVVNKYSIEPKNVVLTGGDAHKFGNINKKYKKMDFLILRSLAQLIEEKKW